MEVYYGRHGIEVSFDACQLGQGPTESPWTFQTHRMQVDKTVLIGDEPEEWKEEK
jgi:hypothetical protein